MLDIADVEPKFSMSSQYRVHIIEDDRSTRRLLENVTKLLGYEISSYVDGAEAWNAFSVEQPKIVVSDWMLPKMDGLELCRRIRENMTDGYTYFVLVSAQKRSRSNLEQALDAGVDDFLRKPISSDEIWNRLRVAERILDFSHQVRRLESLIPICCYCKKVRTDSDLWEQIEQYVNERTGADFTHSICPECMDKIVRPQMESYKRSLRENVEAQNA